MLKRSGQSGGGSNNGTAQVLAIIGTVSATTGGNIFGLLGFIGLLVWVLGTSVLLILESEPQS